ncbi:MAG TPA: ABC transporter permease subunit [Solirubrobacteraceae bacterium]|jgi:phosphate transport system permease protein|nr:ABC transporter permease subunit [Solirubrobacteraceae bacterium]
MSTFVSDPRAGGLPSGSQRGRRSSLRTWRWSDRLVLCAAWAAGLSLCAIAAAILLYMGYRGVQYLRPDLIFSRPQASLNQAGSGGFLDPLLGTALLTVIGIAIAAPLAISSALWIVEYGQGGRAHQLLTRVVESSIEIVAGTPDIVIAVFGLAIFQLHLLAFASFIGEGGGVYGRSFLAAGAMMSLIALPPLFVATRDGLLAVPAHMREAAFALGKTRIATIRRVLLPSVRPNIATGVTLGVSRIIADTAIVIVLLGDELRLTPRQGGFPGLGVLRGTGSSLTSYVYDNSPAGEGLAPQKAYAAAVLLLVFVLLLNLAVERFIRRSQARTGGVAIAGGIA